MKDTMSSLVIQRGGVPHWVWHGADNGGNSTNMKTLPEMGSG